MSQASVLLVGGDADVLRHLIGLFPPPHFRAIPARAGTQVSELLRTHGAVHICIVHEELADMPGRKLTAWLREVLGKQAVIILLTKTLPGRQPEDFGYDQAIRHPTRPGVLNDIVRRLYNRRLSDAHKGPFLEDLRRRHVGLDEKDYYAVLGLSKAARYDTIRDAYDNLSLRFHPDQHLDLKGTPDFELMSELYKRIGEAYRTLTNRQQRAKYDKLLASGQVRMDGSVREKEGPKSLEDLSDVSACKRFLRLAQTALAAGDKPGALQNLKFAKSMDSANTAIQDKIQEIEG